MIFVACGLLANNVSQITFRARNRRGRREKHAGGDRQGKALPGQCTGTNEVLEMNIQESIYQRRSESYESK